jgi:cation:H+ antiporter
MFVISDELPIWANILLLLVGLAITAKGADKFVDSAVAIAQRTGVSKVIIGATIVSLGTTLPEFSVAVLGGLFDRSQTAMGGAIGSTICNIGLALGACLLIRPIVVHRRLYWRQGIIMVLAGVMVVLLSLDGFLSRWDSLILTAGLAGYMYFSVRTVSRARKNAGNGAVDSEQTLKVVAAPTYSLRRTVIWFVLGAAGVGVGATLIVENAVIVAHWLEIPELIIGLTVVALGTSLPEFVTGLTATIKGHGEITLGNIIGADILDILWVLGPGVLSFSLLPVERQTMVLDYPLMLALMVVLLVFTIAGKKLARWHGGVLLGIYGIYLALMFLLFA